jgi:hypothetical protein
MPKASRTMLSNSSGDLGSGSLVVLGPGMNEKYDRSGGGELKKAVYSPLLRNHREAGMHPLFSWQLFGPEVEKRN